MVNADQSIGSQPIAIFEDAEGVVVDHHGIRSDLLTECSMIIGAVWARIFDDE
jgi:hypothetical protein